MVMTKKDYITIAKILNEFRYNDLGRDFDKTFNYMLLRFMAYFKNDNPKFNEETFKKAVLIE